MRVTEEKLCRVCRGELKVILDLGQIVPSGFNKDKVVSREAPLVLAECEDCKLVQLKHTVDLDLMYRQYWYASSLNKSMVNSLQDVVSDVYRKIKLNSGDVVVDIGCNDGTMLMMYPDVITKVGFDPALNIERPSGFFFVNEYFSAADYHNTWGLPKAKVVTAIAMFYDLPDPHQFVEDVVDILRDDGIFVIQFTDLLSMYKACAFDNICHEHLEYYKLADVKFLLETHGLEVIDVSYNDVNGGSIRITAAHQGQFPVSESVGKAYYYETKYMEIYGFKDFVECIEKAKQSMYNFLTLTKNLKLKVFLLGASTKGNTLLQVCGVTSEFVPYAAEVNKDKFGLYTAGTNIYIIPEEEALSMKPDFFLVPIWHFEESILRNSKIREYIRQGGTMVFPLPVFHMISEKEIKDD